MYIVCLSEFWIRIQASQLFALTFVRDITRGVWLALLLNQTYNTNINRVKSANHQSYIHMFSFV